METERGPSEFTLLALPAKVPIRKLFWTLQPNPAPELNNLNSSSMEITQQDKLYLKLCPHKTVK